VVWTYLVVNFPYSTWGDNIFELFNEAIVTLFFIGCIHFADSSIEPSVADLYGFCLIGLVGINIAVNTMAMLIANVSLLITKLKELWLKLKNKFSRESESVVKMAPVNPT
jgi:hypothetical protein